MVTVRYAEPADIDFVSQDGHVPREVVAEKVGRREVIVAEAGGAPVGYLRIEYLWSKVPYLALIHVREEHQRQGVGKALLAFLKQELRTAGATVLFSSATGDEFGPQEWHLHMGFTPAGSIAHLNAGGIHEVFFRLAL